tara:strand:+ start:1447 stop:1731 length:285 start_codon:yes stop_codon:yes gene_type:complete
MKLNNHRYEVILSDGISQLRKFNHEKQAIDFMKKNIDSNQDLREIAIYRKGTGFHSTAQTEFVIKFWGDGSYLDNVSKRNKQLATKKLINEEDR